MLARRVVAAAVSTGVVQGAKSSQQPYKYGTREMEILVNSGLKLPCSGFALPSVMC